MNESNHEMSKRTLGVPAVSSELDISSKDQHFSHHFSFINERNEFDGMEYYQEPIDGANFSSCQLNYAKPKSANVSVVINPSENSATVSIHSSSDEEHIFRFDTVDPVIALSNIDKIELDRLGIYECDLLKKSKNSRV